MRHTVKRWIPTAQTPIPASAVVPLFHSEWSCRMAGYKATRITITYDDGTKARKPKRRKP